MAKKDYKAIAEKILELVGGKANVSFATHCVTRLRLNVKDRARVQIDEIKKIPGVLGAQWMGDQFQAIIGQDVPRVYAPFCQLAELAMQEAVDENLDKPKEKLTLKKFGSNVLGYLSGTMTGMIPIMMGGALLKTVQIILESMLGTFPGLYDTTLLLDFIFDAALYFMPIYIGYFAADRLGMNPSLGMYLGGVLMAPDFLTMVSEGTEFTILGLQVYMKSYAQSFIPIVLSVAAAYYIEKLFKKLIPDVLATTFVPTCTILCSTVVALLVTAPAGYILGEFIATALLVVSEHTGVFGVAVIAAFYEYLVLAGAHSVVIMPVITTMMNGGTDPLVFPAAMCATCAVIGMALGTFLRMKNKEEKSMACGFFVTGICAFVTEPIIFGIGMKYRKPFLAMSVGAFAGGIYMGLNHVIAYNFMNLLAFSGGTTVNFVNGIIACMISMFVTAALTYFFCFTKEEIETGVAA